MLQSETCFSFGKAQRGGSLDVVRRTKDYLYSDKKMKNNDKGAARGRSRSLLNRQHPRATVVKVDPFREGKMSQMPCKRKKNDKTQDKKGYY